LQIVEKETKLARYYGVRTKIDTQIPGYLSSYSVVIENINTDAADKFSSKKNLKGIRTII
jgi:hypothetical protein